MKNTLRYQGLHEILFFLNNIGIGQKHPKTILSASGSRAALISCISMAPEELRFRDAPGMAATKWELYRVYSDFNVMSISLQAKHPKQYPNQFGMEQSQTTLVWKLMRTRETHTKFLDPQHVRKDSKRLHAKLEHIRACPGHPMSPVKRSVWSVWSYIYIHIWDLKPSVMQVTKSLRAETDK